MSFADNKRFWESFLLLYKAHPCLWKVKCKGYKNKAIKKQAYQVLVQKCRELYPEADQVFVRKKIESFRGGFRREVREMREHRKSGTDVEYQPTLWYFDLLRFTQEQDGSCSEDEDEEADYRQNIKVINNNLVFKGSIKIN